jgi:hypothetical protein
MINHLKTNPNARAVYIVGLQSLDFWDCGFESRRGHACLSLVSAVWCRVEVSASGWSLVKRSPTECGVSECDLETSIMRRPRPTRGCRAMKKNRLKSKKVKSLIRLWNMPSVAFYICVRKEEELCLWWQTRLLGKCLPIDQSCVCVCVCV